MDWLREPATDEQVAAQQARDAETNRQSHRAALGRELAGVEDRIARWKRKADAFAAEAADTEAPHWRNVLEAERDAALRTADNLAARADLIRLEQKAVK